MKSRHNTREGKRVGGGTGKPATAIMAFASAVLSFQKKLFSNKNTGMHPEKQKKQIKASRQEAGIHLQSIMLLKKII